MSIIERHHKANARRLSLSSMPGRESRKSGANCCAALMRLQTSAVDGLTAQNMGKNAQHRPYNSILYNTWVREKSSPIVS